MFQPLGWMLLVLAWFSFTIGLAIAVGQYLGKRDWYEGDGE